MVKRTRLYKIKYFFKSITKKFYASNLDFIRKRSIIITIATKSQKRWNMYQTNHQKVILDFFKKHQEEAFTAYDLICRFQDEINKATVYRKLHQLEENKVIRKSYNLNKKSYEYQYAEDCDNHLHLICKFCGRVTHLKCEQTSSFVSHLSKHHGFLIDQGSTMIFGLCEECKAHA